MSKSQQHTYKKINTPVWIFFLKNLSSFQIPSIPGICAYMPHDVYECIWRIWQPWATMDFPTTCDDIQPRLIPLSVLDGLSHLHHWVFGVLSCPLLSVCFKLCHLNLITVGNSFWNRNMYVYIYHISVHVYININVYSMYTYVHINILYETLHLSLKHCGCSSQRFAGLSLSWTNCGMKTAVCTPNIQDGTPNWLIDPSSSKIKKKVFGHPEDLLRGVLGGLNPNSQCVWNT